MERREIIEKTFRDYEITSRLFNRLSRKKLLDVPIKDFVLETQVALRQRRSTSEDLKEIEDCLIADRLRLGMRREDLDRYLEGEDFLPPPPDNVFPFEPKRS